MADGQPNPSQVSGRKTDEWTGLWLAQYKLLRFLDLSSVKKVVVGLVLIYVGVGLLSIAFHLDIVCVSPKLVVRGASQQENVDGMMDASVLLQVAMRTATGRARREPMSLHLKTEYYVQECAYPTSLVWKNTLFAIGFGCCLISSLLVFEHVLRMSSATSLYYVRNWWLLLDFAFAFTSWISDIVILTVLQPKLFHLWDNVSKDPATKYNSLQMTIILLRLIRLGLINRAYRFMRAEWNPASEVARTMEVIELLKADMPHIDLLSVQVVRNQRYELLAYEHRKQVVQSMNGEANEVMLFFGSHDVPPEKITGSTSGLDARYATHGEFGFALYGSERPAYTDCCHAYTDWESDRTGQTRKMIICLSMTGNARHADQVNSRVLARAVSDVHDSVYGGPLEPKEYRPEILGLPRRDVSSTIYGMPEPRGQTLPIAIVTYKNPDAFDEISALSAVGAKSWLEHYAESVDLPTLSSAHAAALKKLDSAIDAGDLESTHKALDNCQAEGVSPHDIRAVKQQKRLESENAGVCLSYLLSDEFKQLAQQATDSDDPSFQEMSKVFFTLPGSQGMGIGAAKMCPRDLKLGCAFIDTLPSTCRKKANLFLSWVWRYKLNMLRNALQRWVEIHQADPDEEFLYVCFFCNNQYRILVTKEASGSDDMEKLFGARLSGIGRVIAIMDAWEDPLYLKRIWTIYEQYMAAKLNVDAEFVLPDTPAATLMGELGTGKGGITKVIEAISHVDAESAEASMEEDERKVKALIRKDIGFATVNSVVQKRITAWMSQEFKNYIDNMVADIQRSSSLQEDDSTVSCRQT